MIIRAAAISAVLLAASSLAAQATPPSKAESPRPANPPCFRLSDLGGHRIASPDTLYYSVRRKEVYKFTFSGSCLAGVTNSDPLILEPLGASSQVCKPLDLNLGVGGPITRRCIIKSIERLTPEQAAALPKKLKP
ncbi:MAG: hypothetical protein IM653_07630 [Phenylobacterium sp.]|uniref:DUF6491 family protein n=1 Tax=Phenylobacterium sp. TaxID=1871053 RepID=UPI0025FF4EDF|nr:DUF6491 family protein [Phenylobacterium sp.]MCA6225440.1 hypothetical protein [Phenylobacterium sp.]MCA6232116.1 hypothetical protein [Phenylobacterium sp.]MCA6234992.1 hypothetical protein [Phenylobacterium sp.]MCA6250056.1 hypothetical protein [Phenylobacterium sp.]MCA6251365.1 hypothetical protein [Phenylobacterium sp.]